MALLLLSLNTILSAQDYTPWYSGSYTRTDRKLNSVTLTSPAFGAQPATAGSTTYTDLTSTKTLRAKAGETLTVSFNCKGEWMHGYVYIDTDKDGFTAGVNSSTHAPTGDLMSYSFYSGNDTSDGSGYNSGGTYLSGGSRNTLSMPTFTCPSTPGTFRMRFKTDWNSIDPAGDSNSANDDFKQNGGGIIDVTLYIYPNGDTAPSHLNNISYFRIKNGDYSSARRKDYLCSDYSYIQSKHSFLKDSDSPSTNDFMWKLTVDGSGKWHLVSGQGLPLMLKDGTTYESGLTYSASNYSYSTTDLYKIYFTEAINGTQDQPVTGGDANHPGLTTWTDPRTGNANDPSNFWFFQPVIELGTAATGAFYTVSITKSVESLDISNARITKTETSELAFNGGFFYCTTTPTASDFTATDIENTTSTIVVDENAKTITVTYSEAAVYITDTEIAEAQALRDLAGKVGYPSLTSEAYSTFNTFVSSLSTSTTTVAAYTAAVNAFKTATDIALPEDGKAYKIKCQAHEWSAYVKYGEVGTGKITLVGSTTADTHETTFICHEISAGNYLFVDNAGRYLKWVCDQDTRVYDATGANATTYNSTYNVLSLARASVDANGGRISSDVEDTDFFGRIEIKGTRVNGTTQSYLNMRHKTGDGENYPFISEGGLERYYDTDTECRSHTFIFEETPYPNLVNLTQATGIDDGTKKIATFSAPFAFTLPENVDAYVVAQTPSASAAQMTQLATAGSTVAANTGVILYGATTETQVRMIPATETGASNASSLLGNSAGGTKQIVDVAGQTNYILASKGGSIVFSKALANGENKSISMNKAYLSIPAGSPVNQFALSFGEDGPTTGIGSIEAGNAGSAAAPLYDLSGRRISQPATRGIYIRSGKKFMVK